MRKPHKNHSIVRDIVLGILTIQCFLHKSSTVFNAVTSIFSSQRLDIIPTASSCSTLEGWRGCSNAEPAHQPGMLMPMLSVMGLLGAEGSMNRMCGSWSCSISAVLCQPLALSPRPCRHTTVALCEELGPTVNVPTPRMIGRSCCAEER